MGKSLIIKGADFSTNAVEEITIYDLPLTKFDGSQVIETNYYLLSSNIKKWIMKAEHPSPNIQNKHAEYSICIAGSENNVDFQVLFQFLNNVSGIEDKNRVVTYNGSDYEIIGFTEPITTIYFKKDNDIIYYSLDNANWVQVVTLSNMDDVPQNHGLVFGGAVGSSATRPELNYRGTLRVKLVMGRSNYNFT